MIDTQKLKEQLINTEREIFGKYGLEFYPEVIVHCFDPYSLNPERGKVYMDLVNAWLRLKPDGEVTFESAEYSYFITVEHAHALEQMLRIPLYPIENTDVYQSKLEADLNRKPIIVIPDYIDTQGAILPFNAPILQSLIIQTIMKFRGEAGYAATQEQIINYLTMAPPDGGGWYKRTATLITKVKHTLETMTYRNLLFYDEPSGTYALVNKPAVTKLQGAMNP